MAAISVFGLLVDLACGRRETYKELPNVENLQPGQSEIKEFL